jgi:hypothetical protein
MGTDNLFKKRKARNAQELQRKTGKREAYARILIVCEGSKTEPAYFEGLRTYYQLKTANIEICGKECGSAPDNILQYAQQRFIEERNAGNAFDQVYCVFDKDTHSSYQSTVDAIQRKSPQNTWFAITSVPCFEYWLLLHFYPTSSPYHALPGKSAGQQLLDQLKQCFPSYTKNQSQLFTKLLPQLNFARQNATRQLEAAKAIGSDNPSTYVHTLVDKLQSLKITSGDGSRKTGA